MEVFDNEEKIELTYAMLKNKLFCSFSTEENLENLLRDINSQYSILYKKIFVLSSPDSHELLVTYNIEDNGKPPIMMKNTILVHRKKESNTLYTVNALNELIKKLNNGVQDSTYIVNWSDYRNSILLSQSDGLRILKTQIHKIVNV